MPRKTDETLAPVYPNAGVTVQYRRALLRILAEMHRSVVFWVKAAYRANPPEMAQDASPAKELQGTLKDLADRWEKRFEEGAKELGAFYAQAMADRSDAALKAILRKAGFSVKFKMTRTMNDVLQATIGEQVGLIKSIPAKYMLDVQGSVMRSIQKGGDLGELAKELQYDYGVTKRRAALIARDQNNKATASFNRVRQTELGITQAEWRHSGGGKKPRPSHVKAGRDRVRYDVDKGWFDPHEQRFIFPGELINCRCVSRSVIPGFI